MTLRFRHRIRISSAGGLRPSTHTLVTEASHNIEYWRVSGEATFLFPYNVKARIGFKPAISDFPYRQLQPLHQGPRPGWCSRKITSISLKKSSFSLKHTSSNREEAWSAIQQRLDIQCWSNDTHDGPTLIRVWRLCNLHCSVNQSLHTYSHLCVHGILPCKSKRQYLLALQVSKYFLVALLISIVRLHANKTWHARK